MNNKAGLVSPALSFRSWRNALTEQVFDEICPIRFSWNVEFT